jgi:hypothetical protein
LKQAPPINPAMAQFEYSSLQWIGWLLVVVVDAYSHSSIRQISNTCIPQTVHCAK